MGNYNNIENNVIASTLLSRVF